MNVVRRVGSLLGFETVMLCYADLELLLLVVFGGRLPTSELLRLGFRYNAKPVMQMNCP